MKRIFTTKEAGKKTVFMQILNMQWEKNKNPPTERPIQQLVYFIFP